MKAATKELLAFHVAARVPGFRRTDLASAALRPALLRRYRDLTRLRHDDPLILIDHGSCRGVESLSNVVNGLLQREAPAGPAGEELRRRVLRLEREMRSLVVGRESRSFSQLWQAAAASLAAQADLTDDERQALTQDLDRAYTALDIQGDIVGCGDGVADLVVRHLWRRTRRAATSRVRSQLRELRIRLKELLQNDDLQSADARSPEALRVAFGGRFDHLVDFDAMSRTLLGGRLPERMPQARRERIEWALSVLETEQFFGTNPDTELYTFEFPNCLEALAALQHRLPCMADLVKAIRLAALELENRYRGDTHDDFFHRFDAAALTAADFAWFPAHLVSLREEDCDAANQAASIEILASDLPIKLLLRTSRLFRNARTAGSTLGNTVWATQLAKMAVNLHHAFVLQTTSSNLGRLAEGLAVGLAAPGPALFSVFSPTADSYPGVPPYLAAAAALESRAFPSLIFDPHQGASWASCFRLEGNPQPERVWPIHAFAYEDEAMQSISEMLAFTVVDFLALDPSFADAFLPIPRRQWSAEMIPLAEYLEAKEGQDHGRVPFILMVGEDDQLQRVVVKSSAVRLARRCARAWRSFQELAGIDNSHTRRALESARQEWEAEQRKPGEESRSGNEAGNGAPAKASPAAPQVEVSAERAPAVSRDEAYIETARCTSCNECTNRNNRMFKYNDKKQAYLADVRAGTYRQLVEAAEVCKLALIHPGKPWNPNEPDLTDLLRRAEPFR